MSWLIDYIWGNLCELVFSVLNKGSFGSLRNRPGYKLAYKCYNQRRTGVHTHTVREKRRIGHIRICTLLSDRPNADLRLTCVDMRLRRGQRQNRYTLVGVEGLCKVQ